MKAEFIKDIQEGLFFTKKASLEKMDLEQAAHYCLLIFCALNILKHEKDYMHFAQQYAQKTLAYNDFRGFRSNSTDLYNLLAILNDTSETNLQKLKHHSANEILAKRISLPTLQAKAYLRHVASGELHEDQDRNFLFKLDKALYNTNSDYSAVRRLASDWHRLLPNERKLALTRLLLAMRHMGSNDILSQLEKLSKTKGYEIKDVCDPETGKGCGPKTPKTSALKQIGKTLAIGLGAGALGYALVRDKKL